MHSIDINQAFNNHEFFMVYQSQHDNQGKTVGYEALLRLNQNGQIFTPPQFLEMVYTKGLAIDVTKRIIDLALDDYIKHRSDMPENCKISINIYPEHLSVEGFHHYFISQLRQRNIHPKCVALEVLEMYEIPDSKHTHENIQKFQDYGIKLFLDDLGAGFSTIDAMKKFRLDGIKIDRELTWAFAKNPDQFPEFQRFFSESQSLCVVVEGIENKEMLDVMLEYLPNAQFQGYFFSTPSTFTKQLDKV